MGQQAFAVGHEGAPVADPGQRITKRGSLELQFGALLDHGQRHVSDPDDIQHGFEQHEGEKTYAIADT
ncbi:hypothetical protein D3C81_1091780 [compost metagenome]